MEEARVACVGEVPREIPTRDLARRPPQRLERHLGLAGDRAQVAWLGAGEQHAAQDRTERLGVIDGAERGRDCRRGGIRLLGGDSALLDRKRGGVPGGPHALDVLDRAVHVDRDEAVLVLREPMEPGTVKPRKGDDRVRTVRMSAAKHDSLAVEPASHPPGEQFDPGLLEQSLDGLGDPGAERLERA